MTATETPSPPAPVERRCPRCGARLSAEQEWCLSCGAAVGTRVAAPRGWRVPFAVIGVLLLLALVALVLALVELAGPAEKVTEVPATPTPTPPPAVATTTPVPSVEGEVTPSPEGSATPSATPTATPGEGSPALADWPSDQTGWTVVVNSSGSREDAERLAGELAAKGVPDVGVLDSDDFDSLGPDSFVVFAGQYKNRAEAEEGLQTIRDRAGGGSTRRIVPKQG